MTTPTPDSPETPTQANERMVLGHEAAADTRVDALPMKLTFEFTGDCNIHCFFCDCEFNRNEFRKQGITKFGMDEETFRAIAENAFPMATVINPTVVGEPFTFKYFDLLLEYAAKYDTKLEIVTNGMLLKGKRLERLMPVLDRLVISFDGGTKETFEHCRTGASWDKVIENLERFRDLRTSLGLRKQVKLSFAVTLMRENIEEFPLMVEWAHRLDADEVNAGHLLVFTKELRGSSLLEHRELSDRSTIAAHQRAHELGIPISAPALFDASLESQIPTNSPPPVEVDRMAHEAPPPDWAPGRYWCKFAWREAFISITGDVAPCCHQDRPVIGNVFNGDEWDSMWNGPVWQRIRQGLHDKEPTPFCATCSLLQEQGQTEYDERGYLFEDRYPEQARADVAVERPKDRKNGPPSVGKGH